MAAVFAFAISLGALIAFLGFKLWEVQRGARLLYVTRRQADTLVERISERIARLFARATERASAQRIVHTTLHHSAWGVARIAQGVERQAHSIAERVSRSATDAQLRTETKSQFLKQVSTHKANLDTDRIKRETSLTGDMPE